MRNRLTLSLLALSAMLTAAVTAQPQTIDTGPAAGPTHESMSTSQETTTTGTSTKTTGTTGATGKTQLQGQDAEFLRKAMQGGREEVHNAQVVMRNAQRAETRNIASMMLEDHRRSNERLEQLAQRKGWSVPAASDMDTESGVEADQPAGTAAGRDFDQQYMKDEIRHHRETISLYRAQASGGSDPELRQFARDALPQLEHHLEMLEGGNTQK